ncbi:MAG: calcium-binding protein [Myxococcaceae bacterium]
MTLKTRPATSKKDSRRGEFSAAKLDELIAEATIDAHDESEQTTGFYTMFEEHLAVPFKTAVLGVEVTVDRIDMTDDERIVAVCARDKSRQRIPIADLPLPEPPPKGSEWIAAYRRWARGR